MFSRQPLVVGFYFIHMIDWGKLSASEKAQFMRIAIEGGINKLDDIRELYNSYRDGGVKPKSDKRRSIFNREKVRDRVLPVITTGKTPFAVLKEAYRQYRDPNSSSEQFINDRQAEVEDIKHRGERYEGELSEAEGDLLMAKQHEDAKRIYLGYEPKYGTMEPSPYRPTIGKSANPYQVNPLLTDEAFEYAVYPAWAQWKTNGQGYEIQDNGKTALVKDFPYVSDTTLSEGHDERGHYISLYDIWDYNTSISSKSGDNIGKFIGGKPFEIYQRYYLDDWLDIPKESRGNHFLAPAVITDYINDGDTEYKSGGKIHIKPGNRGKFTALKERTGHSASWFKEHGTPAQRKMATFALNARKWHHGEGGYLEEEGEEYFGGTLPAATVSTTLPSIQSKQGQAIAKNMAERVANGQMNLGEVPRRYYNYVQGEAKGAIPMRGYMDKATNVALGTLAVPLATMAAAEAAPVLAPGSALWSNPIVQQAVASEFGGRAVDLVSKDFTGKTWAENMSGAFDKATGLNSSDTFVGQMASEMTNPGYLLSPSHFITKVGINRLPQAAFDNYANRLVKEGFTSSPRVAAEEPKLQQFPEVVKTAPKQELPPYEIEDLGGGYMLKSLMRGNPLEKQLSKQGTVNVNNVKALINKGSDIEKTIVDKVLSGDEFANKKAIDYNKFRKAVQDELIAYDRTPNKTYEDYGLNRLYEDPAGSSAGWYGFLEPETFTFSSSRIPNGSSKHYDTNTLGHSRTYTTAKEPDVLHVMESQSDWAQSGVAKEIKGDLAQSNDLIETYQWRIDQLEKETSTGVDQWGFPISEESMSDKKRILDDVKSWLEKELERNKELASTNSAQAKYLSDNYTTKQIQENLKYAAEQGQTKMRYPTRETAAKIEGYPVSEERLLDYDRGTIEYDAVRKELYEHPEYSPEHELILKKYTNFPKQYKKLFKDADVRTVTDSKGNTWYEVDVPKDYLKKEWIYSTIPVGIGLSEGKEENSYANGGPLGNKNTLLNIASKIYKIF